MGAGDLAISLSVESRMTSSEVWGSMDSEASQIEFG